MPQPTGLMVRIVFLGVTISLSCADGRVLGADSIAISGGEEPPIYLCYNPRHMIPVTTIADGVSCLRRAVLASQMQAGCTFNRPSVHLVAGSVVHDVFEAVISDMGKLQSLASLIADSVRRNLLAVYAAGEDEGSVTEHISTILQSLPSWCQAFLRSDVAAAHAATAQVIDEARASKLGLFADRRMCLPQVFGLEESISVPNFGLKGKLDAVVLARFLSARREAGGGAQGAANPALASMMVPLELKTGKSLSSASHRAQTLLYTLMLSQRYGLPVPFGLLYYVASGSMLRIMATPLELQALLMIRNRIAAAALGGREGGLVPAPIKNAHLCRQCPQLENCAVLARLQPSEGKDRGASVGDDGELNGTILSQVRQLGSAQLDLEGRFYGKWEQLIRLEEEVVLETKDRPSSGSHIREVVLTGCQSASDDCPSSFGRYIAEFSIICAEDAQAAAPHAPAASIEFSEGDPIIIYHQRQPGEEGGPLDEAAIGFLTKTEGGGHLTVSCDRNIGRRLVRAPGFDPERAHLWREVSRVGCRFLLRRDEMLAGFTYARSNLVRLFAPQCSSLRHLLVDLRAPKFDPQAIVRGGEVSEIQPILASLDLGQQEAIHHCMAAQDYALMLGMPGTGKTTTLVALIRLLVHRGASVLVASYTHSAVDNVLTKLQDCGVGVLRLGNSDRVDRRLHPCLVHPQNFASTAALREALSMKRVVGTSCLGANHAVLASVYPFDYCIVDEAAQITVPVVIGPLLLARRFILVGDHYQLPPLVRSKRALDLGLDVSLFKILAEAHPSAVATLRRQYRMNEDVQLVANRIVYGGLLECASDAVARRCLYLDRVRLRDFAGSWLGRVLDPASRVLFLDTDPLGAPETAIGGSYGNYGEAAIIKLLVTTLTEHFAIDPIRIGVITAFRPQVRIIREACDSRHAAALEVSTVDKYQGRDKDCIILSFVRSNAEATVSSSSSSFLPYTNTRHHGQCPHHIDWNDPARLAPAQRGLYPGPGQAHHGGLMGHADAASGAGTAARAAFRTGLAHVYPRDGSRPIRLRNFVRAL